MCHLNSTQEIEKDFNQWAYFMGFNHIFSQNTAFSLRNIFVLLLLSISRHDRGIP